MSIVELCCLDRVNRLLSFAVRRRSLEGPTIVASNHKGSWGTRIVLAAILGAYVVSFFLPVTDAGTPRAMFGYQAFFWAFVSIIYLPMWLANPALWVGCVCYGDGKWKAARNAGLLAALLAISEIWFWDDRPEIGYFLWLGSMLLLASAGGIQTVRTSLQKQR